MKKADVLSIMVTFLFGVFAGGYLYLTGFAPIESELTVPNEVKVAEFTIIADAYGGCRDTCPSFQVTSDGSYRYLYTPTAGANQVLRKGKLPYDLNKKLRTVVTKESLQKQSTVIKPATCNSYVDGVDVAYEITLDGVTYKIDSCGTTADGNSVLWTTLSAVWSYFETI